jgi:EAL domain-containing protein (putative c-di-GMP-specific phosphodiesterase class I)
MSNWPELLSEGRLVPYFQPIVSTESMKVAAFEALGRLDLGGQVVSLGPFFHPSVSDERQPLLIKQIDRLVRKAAMTLFLGAEPETRLFLNIRPGHMLDHLSNPDHELPWTLRTCLEIGLDPKRLVIELTEEAIAADTQHLKILIEQYRAHGCAIAIDDVGAESSNLDRVGYFEPDIIKVDAVMLRRSRQERSFREVLRGLSTMAEGLGSSLLFEGVESEADLEQALLYGARYIQGFYLAPALSSFVPTTTYAAQVRPVLQRFGAGLEAHAEQVKARIRSVSEALAAPPTPVLTAGRWDFSLPDLERWKDLACRVFLTDHAGFQVSPNFELVNGTWVPELRGLGTCRAMRPYFPGASDHRWQVSNVYYDINDTSLMRTFSRPAPQGLTVFVDVLEIENPALKR